MKESFQKGKCVSILVIEDEESIRRLLSSILGMEGHEVRSSSNAVEGLALFKEKAADLVITDLGLPDESGWEVARHIKDMSPSTPVILITGWGVSAEVTEAKRRGVDYVLPKPFEFADLSELISRALSDLEGRAGAEDVEAALRREILSNLREDKLPCAVAHALAERVGTTPQAVGELADELEIRISRCQLGLFGYGEKRLGQHKIVEPSEVLQPELASALGEAATEGVVTCAQLFEIAERLNVPKMTVSAHAEALGLKITQCQLGCFP